MTFRPSDLAGDLFHLCGPIIDPGAILRPGNYGRIIRRYGWLHSHSIREHALEEARKRIAPHLPSRLHCAFVFPTFDEAVAFRSAPIPGRNPQGFEGHIVYRVRLVEPGASWYLADHSAVAPRVHLGMLNEDWPATYWGPLAPAGTDQTMSVDGRTGSAAGGNADTAAESRIRQNLLPGMRELLTMSALRIEERYDGL